MAATLKDAVRALVVERPRYGYEIANQLDQRLAVYAWQASGVYAVLDQLVNEEDVRFVGEKKGQRASGRAAPRIVYEATPRGIRSNREWLLSSSAPARVRQELDLKIQLAGAEMLPELIEQLFGQEQVCLGELKGLGKAVRPTSADVDSSWREVSAILQRNGAIVMLEARIKVLQEARRVIQATIDGRSS